MRQFIKLHTKEGDEVYINTVAIESMRYVPAAAKTVLTIIGCENGWFNIQETPEDVIHWLKRTEWD